MDGHGSLSRDPRWKRGRAIRGAARWEREGGCAAADNGRKSLKSVFSSLFRRRPPGTRRTARLCLLPRARRGRERCDAGRRGAVRAREGRRRVREGGGLRARGGCFFAGVHRRAWWAARRAGQSHGHLGGKEGRVDAEGWKMTTVLGAGRSRAEVRGTPWLVGRRAGHLRMAARLHALHARSSRSDACDEEATDRAANDLEGPSKLAAAQESGPDRRAR